MIRSIARATRRAWTRAATVATVAMALTTGTLAAPATADAADPDAPFRLPRLWDTDTDAGVYWPGLFSGADDQADYLRSGGVACEKPDPLPVSNAGDDIDEDGIKEGYRVPFTMALTDGRALALYSPLAKAAGQFPFGAGVYGITGWVRGWVGLPSLQIEIPDDGIKLCPGSGMAWTGTGDQSAPGMFQTVTAAADAPDGGPLRVWSEVEPVGTPRASITGLTPSGALEFQASLTARVHAMNERGDGRKTDCTMTLELGLGTAPASLPATFPLVEGVLPSDPGRWLSTALYNRFYSNPFDLRSAPPTRYQMPPRALDGALPGRSATVVNGTAAMPPFAPPSPPRTGVCPPLGGVDGDTAAFFRSALAPVSLDGTSQPAWPVYGGQLTPFAAFLRSGPMPEYEVPSGAVQTSIDITVADIGMPTGLPRGYGFS